PKRGIEPRIRDILRKLKLSGDYSYPVDKLLKRGILTDNVLKNTELAKEYANNAGRAIKNYEILSKYFPVDPIMDRELLLEIEPEELDGIIRGIPEGMRTVEEIKEGIKKLKEKKELREEERAIKPEVLEKEFENLSKKQRYNLVIIKGLCERSRKGEITHYQNRVFREVTSHDLAKVFGTPVLARQIVNQLVDTNLIETRRGIHFLPTLTRVVFYSINRNAIKFIEEYEKYLSEIKGIEKDVLKVIRELDLNDDEKRILINIYEGKGLADIRKSLIRSFIRNTLSKFKELGYIRKVSSGWELTYKFEKLLYSLALKKELTEEERELIKGLHKKELPESEEERKIKELISSFRLTGVAREVFFGMAKSGLSFFTLEDIEKATGIHRVNIGKGVWKLHKEGVIEYVGRVHVWSKKTERELRNLGLIKSPFSYHLLPERIKKDINLGLMKEEEVFFRMIELRMMQSDSVITRARIREIIPGRQLGALVTLSRRGYIREVEGGYELSIERDIRKMQRELKRMIRNTESGSEPFESRDSIENALLSYVSLWRKSGEKVNREFIEKRNPKLYELCNRFGINIDEILEKSSEELDREIERRKEFYEESARYVSKYTFRVIEESYPAIEQRMKVMRLEKERRVNADELWSKLHEEEKEDLRKTARTALRREYKKSLYYNSNGAIEEKAKLLLLKTRERPGWSRCPIPFCVGGEILSALSFCCDPHMKGCKYRTGVLDEIGLSEARFKEIKDEFARENNWFSNEVCFESLSYCCMTRHCPDRDHVLMRLYGTYLFSIDPAGLKAKPGESSLSEILKELRESFRSHGIALSENAMIEETEGGELEITDRGEVYIIKRDKGELRVYRGDLEKALEEYFRRKRLLAIRLLDAAENRELVKPYLEGLRGSVEREKESSPVVRETKTQGQAGYFMSEEKPVPNKTTKNPKDIELMILENKLRKKCEIKHTEWDELEIPYKEKPHRGVVHTIYRKGLMGLRRIGRIMTSYDHDKKIGYIGHTELSKGYRGKGLSYNILNIAFNDLISRGATKFVVSRVMPYGQIIYRRLSVGIIKSLMNYGFAPEFDSNSLKKENLQKISISHRRGSPIAYKVKLKGKTIWAILTDENGDPITDKDYYKAHRDIDFIRKEYEEGRVLLGNVRYEVKDYDKFWSQMSVVKPPEILDITDSLKDYVKLNSKDIDGIRGNVYGWVVRNEKRIYWKNGIYYLTREDYADCCKYLKTDDLGVGLSEILTKDIGKSLQRAIKLRGREREKRLNEIWMEFKRILKSCNPIERHSKIHDLWNNGILKIEDEDIRREVKKSLRRHILDLDTDTRNEILLLMKKDHDYSVEEISVDETGIDVRKLKETFFTFREYMNTVLSNPKWGYYGSGKAKIGGRAIEKRDFDTFPEILSPLFGEMVAKQIFAMWWSMKEAGLIRKGEAFEILELGAGSGILAHDILSYL
ncbi:MAG: hypothetical protein DRO90_02350, partial [Candidatus Altiarchaeales archaeon]